MFLVLLFRIFQGMNFSALISVVALEMSLIPARLRLELQSFQSDVQDFAEEGSKLLAYYSHSTSNALHVCLRGWCGTLYGLLRYFEEGDVVLWRGWCGTLKRVVWHFEEGGVVPWRGWYGTFKVAWCSVFVSYFGLVWVIIYKILYLSCFTLVLFDLSFHFINKYILFIQWTKENFESWVSDSIVSRESYEHLQQACSDYHKNSRYIE